MKVRPSDLNNAGLAAAIRDDAGQVAWEMRNCADSGRKSLNVELVAEALARLLEETKRDK
jgi:hypothetical protein